MPTVERGFRFVDFWSIEIAGDKPRCSRHPAFPSDLRTDAHRTTGTPYTAAALRHRSCQMPEMIYPNQKVRSGQPAHFSEYQLEMFFRLCSLALVSLYNCFAISVPQLSLTLLCFIMSLLTYFIVTVFPVIMLSITTFQKSCKHLFCLIKLNSAKHKIFLGS